MIITADSKLMYGVLLGNLLDTLELLRQKYSFPQTTTDPFALIEWFNTQIPEPLFLDISYNHREDDYSTMKVYLNLLEDVNGMTREDMIHFLNNVDTHVFKTFLDNLQFTGDTQPHFHLETYKY